MTPDALLAEVEEAHRAESMLMARKLAAIAALLAHRVEEAAQDDPDPGYSMITGFARATAEVSAALNLSPMGSSHLVGAAEDLDERLPKVAALLAEGRTDWRTVQLIVTRTRLVHAELIGRLDTSLATRIGRWNCWSRRRIINAVDAAVRAIDPGAAKQRRVAAHDDRQITVTTHEDGMAHLRGTLAAGAARAFDKRLSQLATSVCPKDPRSLAQRRADALLALTEGRHLACACDRPQCPAREVDAAPTGTGVRTVINVIATQATVAGHSDQPGYLEGYGVIDADQVREMAKTASSRMITPPAVSPAEALRYQPSAALERWVRCRDVTCRFPGCDRPAGICDLDHTIPFNHADPESGGLTVAWNLACYCREHHRLKTFLGGLSGWQDVQLRDGTIVWTSPTRRVYRTTPGGAELFSDLRPPACREPAARRRNRSRERAASIHRARECIRVQRPVNEANRTLNRARAKEIDERKWRNHMRDMLFIFKGRPNTSPFCSWVNDAYEPEELEAGWTPPDTHGEPLPDDPPF